MLKTRSVDQYQGKKFIINDKSELVRIQLKKSTPKNILRMDNLKVNFEIVQQINLANFFKEYSLIRYFIKLLAKYLG